jgi:hypothetical protein
MGDAMKKIVFCEGKDDVAVVQGLATHLGLNIEVEPYDGKNKLPILLQSLPKRPDFAQQKVTAIAILRDACGQSSRRRLLALGKFGVRFIEEFPESIVIGFHEPGAI